MAPTAFLNDAPRLATGVLEQPGLAEAVQLVAQDPGHAAWAQIQALVGDGIRTLALRLSGHHDLSDDVVQETLLAVREHAATFQPRSADPERDARAWIMKIATNTTFAAMRRWRRQQARDLRYALLRPRWTDDVQVDQEQTERLEALRAALAQLPQLQRTVLILHHLGGLSFSAIATELEVPIGTAKTHAHRALVTLRERLCAHAPALAVADVLARLEVLAHHPLPAPGAHALGCHLQLLKVPGTLHLKGIPVIKALALGLGLIAPLTIATASGVLAQELGAPAVHVAATHAGDDPVRYATVVLVAPSGAVSVRDHASGQLITLSSSNRQLAVQVDGGAWKAISDLVVGDHVSFAQSVPNPPPPRVPTTPSPPGWGTIIAVTAGAVTVQDHPTGITYQLPIPSRDTSEQASVPLIDGTWKDERSLVVGDRIRNDLQLDAKPVPPGTAAATATVVSNDGVAAVLRLADGTTLSVPIPSGTSTFSSWTVGSSQTVYRKIPSPAVQVATVESNDGTSLVLRLKDGSHETVPIPPQAGSELSDWAPGESVRLSPYHSSQRLERLPGKTAQ